MRTTPHANEPKNLPRALARLLGIWRSFWALPLLLILGAILVVFVLTGVDGAGLANWLWDEGIVLAETQDGTRDTLAVLVGMHVAFTTLYFSITLLVLTIAAGNLGVRLIDRWIARPFVRTTLGFMLGSVAASTLSLMMFDGSSDGAGLPHGTILFLAMLTAVQLVWLAVALNELGRAIFVDTAISAIGRAGREANVAVLSPTAVPEWPDATPIRADATGYIAGTDIEALSKIAATHGFWLRIDRAAGDAILPGEIIATSDRPLSDDLQDEIRRRLPLSNTRSDREGLSFRFRLLVEIAARALSPAVNDFYTARACVDEIAAILADQHARLVPPGHLLMEVDRIICPTASFDRLFDQPLAALRQAAAAYPSISIRIVERLGVAAASVGEAGFTAHLRSYAREVVEHASQLMAIDKDRDDLGAAFERAFPDPSAELRAVP